MRNSIYSVTVEEALTSVRGTGFYQRLVAAICTAGWVVQGFATSSFLLSLYRPQLDCDSSDCCETDYQVSTQGAAKDWDLVCDTEGVLKNLNVLFLVSLGAGGLLCLFVSHYKGRKGLSFIGALVAGTGMMISAGSPSVGIFGASLVFTAVALAGATLGTYLLMIESLTHYNRALFSCVIFAGWNVGAVLSSISFGLLEWREALVLGGLLEWLWIPVVLLKVFEPPRSLAVFRGKYSEARSIINLIARINQTGPFTEMLEGEKVIGYQEPVAQVDEEKSQSTQSTRKYSFIAISNGIVSVTEAELKNLRRLNILHLFSLSSVRKRTLLLLVVFATLEFSDSIFGQYPIISEKKYLNELVLLVFEVVGYSISTLLLQSSGRVLGLIMNLSMAGAASMLAVAFDSSECATDATCRIQVSVFTTLLILGRLGVRSGKLVSLLLGTEMLPTSIRSLGLGLIWAAGKTLAIGGVFYLQKEAVILSGGFLMTSAFLACGLPETLGSPMEDFVDEEQEEMKNPVDVSHVEMPSASPKFEKLNEEE